MLLENKWELDIPTLVGQKYTKKTDLNDEQMSFGEMAKNTALLWALLTILIWS